MSICWNTQVAPAADLPGAGQAGEHLEPPGELLRGQLLKVGTVAKLERTRADDAHLAAEDVDQLGEFIEAGAAQEATESSHPRVAFDLEEHTTVGLVEMLQVLQLLFRVDLHCAEFEDPEPAASQPESLLAEEDRASRESSRIKAKISSRTGHSTSNTEPAIA